MQSDKENGVVIMDRERIKNVTQDPRIFPAIFSEEI